MRTRRGLWGRLLRDAAAFGLRVTGIHVLVREAFRREKTAILLYHDPDPELFERHLDYLARHYSVIPFAALADAVESGDWSAIPPKSVVIHLDDGYAANYRLLNSFTRHDARPTMYLCSDVVGSRRAFWSRLDGGRSKRLRLVDNPRLLKKLRDEVGFAPDREYPERQALSSEEIAELSTVADVQSHGRYHFSLFTLDDVALADELSASKAAIERLTGRPCEHFSYPYGDHGAREVEAVRMSGYRTARTTLPGWVGRRADPFRLPIVADVPGDCSLNRLRAQLTGIPRLLKWVAYRFVTRHFHVWRQELLMRKRAFGS